MSKSNQSGSEPSSKKRDTDEVLRTRKRTRISLADQDSSDNEPPSLRGGGRESFTPAAGTSRKPTAQDAAQNRLFRNQGRVPANEGLGIRPPTSSPARPAAGRRPTRRTPARRRRTATGTQAGPAGLTPGDSTEGEGDADANVSGDDEGSMLYFLVLSEHIDLSLSLANFHRISAPLPVVPICPSIHVHPSSLLTSSKT